jgi:hypothetical protein
MTKHFKRIGLVTFIGLSASGAAFAFAQDEDSNGLLASIERGMWQLRTVGGGASGAAASQLCVADPKQLVQIQHGSAACSHFVVRSTANTITISYSCKGAGQGLTTIRKENGRLLQIQSQGIRNSAPFSFSVEGRRAGGC